MAEEKHNWEDLGLLLGIDDDRKEGISILFDRAYNEHLSIRPDDKSDEFTVLIFPAIIRVYTRIDHVDEFDLDDLVEYLQNECSEEKIKRFMSDEIFYNHIDWEAEYMNLIIEPYIDKLNSL